MTLPALVFTETVGPAGAPLLVLGPSLGTSSILWESTAPLLPAYRLIAWDLPGHGASPPVCEPFTVDDLADAVAERIAAEGGPAYVAGVSLGGATTLTLALRHPHLVRAAAVIASGASLGTPESWHERAALVRARSTSAMITGSAERWFAPGSIERAPSLAGRLLHALQDADDESYARCCEALARYDLRASLGEVEPPVRAIWGEFDEVAPHEKSQQIADGVADGSVAVVAGAAHLPPAEQAQRMADLLIDFFEGYR